MTLKTAPTVFSMSQRGHHPRVRMPRSISSLHLSQMSSCNKQLFFLLVFLSLCSSQQSHFNRDWIHKILASLCILLIRSSEKVFVPSKMSPFLLFSKDNPSEYIKQFLCTNLLKNLFLPPFIMSKMGYTHFWLNSRSYIIKPVWQHEVG